MYLARKYTIWEHYLTSPTGDGTGILRDHPSHACSSFLSLLKTLSIGPAGPGIEPATFRSVVRRSPS